MSNIKTLDVRGLPCPQPVIQTRKAMNDNVSLVILVSEQDQAENVQKMAERSGWTVTINPLDSHFELTAIAGEVVDNPVIDAQLMQCSVPVSQQPTLVVLASDSMGKGDESLGRLLMKAYINTVQDLDTLPGKILMFNSAVKLAVKESPVLATLQELEDMGVEILVCGTCLEFFDLKQKLGVGSISNMFDIAGSMNMAGVTYIG